MADSQRARMLTPTPSSSDYVLSEAFFHGFTGRVLRRMLPVVVPAFIVGLCISKIRLDFADLIAFLVVTVVLVASVWFNVRRQRRSFRSFRVTVGEQSITRTQDHFRPLAFTPQNIRQIVEGAQGLTILGTDSGMRLHVPNTLERFDEFKSAVARVHPIAGQTVKRLGGTIWVMPSSLAAMAGMVIVYRSTSPVLVLTTSTLMMAVLVWAFIQIQRSPLMDRRIKRAAWMIVFVLMTLGSAAFRAYGQLTGGH
jgi:hypothetical protein